MIKSKVLMKLLLFHLYILVCWCIAACHTPKRKLITRNNNILCLTLENVSKMFAGRNRSLLSLTYSAVRLYEFNYIKK